MNRFLFFLVLLISTNIFSQTSTVKKKPMKKHLPIELSISFGTQFFYQGYNKAWTENDIGSLLRYTTDEGFKKPMYGINVELSKPISEHFAIGLELGYAKVLDERIQRGDTYFHAIPISLNTTYTLITNNKARLRPFVKVKGGYTFFKSTSMVTVMQLDGGFNYGMEAGLGFKLKKYNFLNNVKLSIGYTDFITNVIIDSALTAGGPFSYNVHRKGMVLKLIYTIPLNNKKKKRKQH